MTDGDGEKETAEKLAQPRTLVRLALLLLLSQGPGHGSDLIHRLHHFGFGPTHTGAVYQKLRRMEDDGLVSSSWELPTRSGPAKKVYALTACGKEHLEGCTTDVRIFEKVLGEFFARHPATAP